MSTIKAYKCESERQFWPLGAGRPYRSRAKPCTVQDRPRSHSQHRSYALHAAIVRTSQVDRRINRSGRERAVDLRAWSAVEPISRSRGGPRPRCAWGYYGRSTSCAHARAAYWHAQPRAGRLVGDGRHCRSLIRSNFDAFGLSSCFWSGQRSIDVFGASNSQRRRGHSWSRIRDESEMGMHVLLCSDLIFSPQKFDSIGLYVKIHVFHTIIG